MSDAGRAVREFGGGSHSRTIYRKLGVNSRAEAVARAEVLRLLEETESRWIAKA